MATKTPNVLRTLEKLPEVVYSVLSTDPSQIIGIKRGVMGFWPINLRRDGGKPADITAAELNAGLVPKPTPAQVFAMENGSLFGWHVPGADPDYVEGLMKKNPTLARNLEAKVA